MAGAAPRVRHAAPCTAANGTPRPGRAPPAPPPSHPQLTYRTFNRDFGLPNHNNDHLAPLLRDELMPAHGRMHRERDPELWYRNRCLDMKYVGVPGAAWAARGLEARRAR